MGWEFTSANSVEEVPFEEEALAQVFYFHTSLTHLSGKEHCLSLATRASFHPAYDEDSQFSHQNARGGGSRITSMNCSFITGSVWLDYS